MKYSVTTKQVTVPADEFIARYRDVERMHSYCLQCPGYGKTWGCPPFGFDPRTCSDGFKTVTFIGTTIEFDEETRISCTTKEKSIAAGRQAMEEVWTTLLPEMYRLESEVPGSRCFTFKCELCPEGCTRPLGKPCRQPSRMRHSLESVGFDITSAAKDLLGIEMEWSTDGRLVKHMTLLTAVMRP